VYSQTLSSAYAIIISMSHTNADIARLQAELALDLQNFTSLLSSNKKAIARIEAGARDELDYAALGYTLHNIYGCVENACLRISKFFENGLSKDNWHRDLLNRMLLDISGIRPAFFTREEYDFFDELRGFRHVFRNIYNKNIDVHRLIALQKRVDEQCEIYFTRAVERYMKILENLRENQTPTRDYKAEAIAVANRLARDLPQSDKNIVRIIGFGSLFEKNRNFTQNSDIDLAIEGGDILKLFGIVNEAPIKVDLVDITDKSDDFSRLVRERGILLFERDKKTP